ncbi:3'(2'),5'-bisphosphate nucleotidase CysQ family protein [Flammeovirga kamogawensis]|uniref:Inositol monophosphatase family protein n=1 Tax=Flammeovirga kamogawensis TaxID=373891 RepID=A0ABX8H1G3_9BACT|nr:inositol monophosphatase family protein [Flammeovirga kamogawensis]MBB6463755.1 fructose-1,6-bisphosphatase/inositol monophosphatase family enzyme [Flammeovirga kamogawensis]QWG09733.1 inositol monophosphatase family protein [Flammeovirga kamogawensis]TRX65246.1 inositol monophosphatase family protein [Flammeovirga kamogawensis]
MSINFIDLCYSIKECTIKAALLIQNYPKEKLKVENKNTGENLASQVVTEVDRLSQELILNELKTEIKKYDLGILTEESADDNSRFNKDYFLCIDPIDGTLPFIEQTSGYSISIALVDKKGIPQIGVIYDLVENNLYHAIKDDGVFKNDIPFQLNRQNHFTLVFDRSFLEHPRFMEIKNDFIKKYGNNLQIISHGGAAMNAIWVLENAPSCYFKFPKKVNGGGSIWDYAASCCLFITLNLIATDSYGQPIQLNQKNTFMNAKGIHYSTESDTLKITEKFI